MRGTGDRELLLKGLTGASESIRCLGLIIPLPRGGAVPSEEAAWNDVLVASCLTPAVTFPGGSDPGGGVSGVGQEPHIGLGIQGQASPGP